MCGTILLQLSTISWLRPGVSALAYIMYHLNHHQPPTVFLDLRFLVNSHTLRGLQVSIGHLGLCACGRVGGGEQPTLADPTQTIYLKAMKTLRMLALGDVSPLWQRCGYWGGEVDFSSVGRYLQNF